MTIVIKSSATSSVVGLEKLRRDPALREDNGGVQFMFDTAFSYSFADAAVPLSGALIGDVSDNGDGTFLNTATGVTYAGGGIDLNGITVGRCHIAGPAGCLASIHAGAQHFMVVGWYKLPTALTWNTDAQVKSIFSTADTTYTAGPEMISIYQNNTPRLEMRRQTSGATHEGGSIDPNSNIFGQVCQVAAWQNAAGRGLRVRSALGQAIFTGARGSNNVDNFSATTPKWGAPPASGVSNNLRVYRGWVEDLEISGRDPLTVLDADFLATIARGVFS